MALTWVTASNPNGSCVEVAWTKSPESHTGGCVEVAAVSECCAKAEQKRGEDGVLILVRDSKDPEGSHLHFNSEEWVAFCAGVRRETFTLPALQASSAR